MQASTHGVSSISEFKHNVRNSLTSLKQQGKVQNPQRGYWEIVQSSHKKLESTNRSKPRFLVTNIVDGDTFDVYPKWRILRRGMQEGVRIRPTGYDAPERSDSKNFDKPTEDLKKLILNKEICIEKVSFLDRYGRLGAKVSFQGNDLAQFFQEYATKQTDRKSKTIYESENASNFRRALIEVQSRISDIVGVEPSLIDTLVDLSDVSNEENDSKQLVGHRALRTVIEQSQEQIAKVTKMPPECVKFRVNLSTGMDPRFRDSRSKMHAISSEI